MIEILFELGSEVILVVIRGKNIQFGSTTYGAQMTDISGMKLNYDGVVKEFPDLKNREDWKEETILRFKDHIKNLKSEEEISRYIINELSGYGYKAKIKKKKGFRPMKLK